MKAGALLLFTVALFAVVALVNVATISPSAYVVQPSKQVLGYCPVSQAGQDCYLGGRLGVCQCKTLDEYLPLYWQRDNCACMVPNYLRGQWASP
ncbi:MAG: hypothetical protein QW165_02200 [Candidatus Woesearchaeota archaeon]